MITITRLPTTPTKCPATPWFICTLWLADYHIAKAETGDDLKRAAELLDWVAAHALPSDVLAEQVHPETGAPLSVSPLTWSHATVVSTMLGYLTRLDRIEAPPVRSTLVRPLRHLSVDQPVPEIAG